MTLNKLNEQTSLIEAINYIPTIETEIRNKKNLLSGILNKKGIVSQETSPLSTIIEDVKKLDKYNTPPEIKSLSVVGKPEPGGATISYTATDIEILRHYIVIPGIYEKLETTKDVGYESPNNMFTYKISGLSPSTSYEVKVIVSDGITEVISETLNITTDSAPAYGISVDETNSNSYNCITYIDGAVGQTPAKNSNWGSWKDKWPFKDIKQCGFKAGKVYKYIKETDEKTYIDGTPVENDVDVMVEIPKVYWKFTTTSKGYEVRISPSKKDDGYMCLAHTIGDREVDHIYIGRYKGVEMGGKLRSVRALPPVVKKNHLQCRQMAQANGPGYQQLCHYPCVLLQILYLIMFKDLNCQAGLGYGFAGYAFNTGNPQNVGCLLFDGLLHGVPEKLESVKFLGIEDWFGNVWEWIDGIYASPSYEGSRLLISKQNVFNELGEGYEDCGAYSALSGNITKVIATTKAGFIAKEAGKDTGSDTTYYSDHTDIYTYGGIARYGSCYNYTTSGGIFRIEIGVDESTSDGVGYLNTGARLIYLG